MKNLKAQRIITDLTFQEQLLRLYLGKYENRFNSFFYNDSGDVVLYTILQPMLIVKFELEDRNDIYVALCEHVPIEEDDPWYGTFNSYQCEIVSIPIEDPSGMKKMETAVAKSLLTGTRC